MFQQTGNARMGQSVFKSFNRAAGDSMIRKNRSISGYAAPGERIPGNMGRGARGGPGTHAGRRLCTLLAFLFLVANTLVNHAHTCNFGHGHSGHGVSGYGHSRHGGPGQGHFGEVASSRGNSPAWGISLKLPATAGVRKPLFSGQCMACNFLNAGCAAAGGPFQVKAVVGPIRTLKSANEIPRATLALYGFLSRAPPVARRPLCTA